jgi:hypothetical protein
VLFCYSVLFFSVLKTKNSMFTTYTMTHYLHTRGKRNMHLFVECPQVALDIIHSSRSKIRIWHDELWYKISTSSPKQAAHSRKYLSGMKRFKCFPKWSKMSYKITKRTMARSLVHTSIFITQVYGFLAYQSNSRLHILLAVYVNLEGKTSKFLQ